MIRDLRIPINSSPVAINAYGIDAGIVTRVATPAFSPAAGAYGPTQNVTITCSTPSSTIYYTTNGDDPTTGSSVYSTPVAISSTATLKAFATAVGLTDSNIRTGVYTINGAVATPTFSPVAGTYGSTQSVTISTTTPSAAIYYTTDGSTPDATDTLYSSAVSVASTTTLKAIGILAGYSDSAVATAAYTISAATNDSLTVTPTVTAPTTTDITIGGISVVSGTIYMVAVPAADSAPSAAQIKAGTDASDVAAIWDDARSVLDTNDFTVEAFGLTDGTAYKVYAVHENDLAQLGTVASSASFTPADVTAPVLSSAEGVATGQTTADLDVNTDTAEGELYVVVTTSATAPSAAQVKLGQDHTGSAAAFDDSDLAIAASGPHSFSATGLTASTTYYVYFMHEDDAGNQSTVTAGVAAFTTASSTTTVVSFATDGTLTNIINASSSALTASQSDSDAGTDAVLWADDNPGTSGAVSIRSANVTLNNGNNNVTGKFKTTGIASGSKMWIRIRMQSVTVTDAVFVDITNDGTAAGSRIGTQDAGWTSATVTSLGSDWWKFDGVLDATGADVTGQFYLSMAEADNDTVLTVRDGTNAIVIHDVLVSYT